MILSEMLLEMEFPENFLPSLKEVRFGENSLLLLLESSLGNHNELNPSVIDSFERSVGLRLDTEGTAQGNLCMANREEVRPEFRTVFRFQELLEYIFALLPTSEDKSPVNRVLMYPTDAEKFWQLVQLGQDKKKQPNEN